MILAIGNINMDWICTVERFPAPDEKVNISELEVHPGGAASNFAVSIARLGSEIGLFGHVGNDSEGKEALRSLAKEKVDTSRIVRDPKLPTGMVIILVSEGGQTTKLRFRGANSRLSSKDITPKLLKGVDIVYGASIEIPIAKKIARLCSDHSIICAIDVGGDLLLQPHHELLKMLQEFSVIFMNAVVFQQIVGEAPTAKNIQSLLSNNLEIINVTCGDKGSFAATQKEVVHMPIFKVKAVDTTGAGDAYAAGFLHFYSKNIPLKDTVRKAAACAALQIKQFGGRAGLPSSREVDEFIQNYNQEHPEKISK